MKPSAVIVQKLVAAGILDDRPYRHVVIDLRADAMPVIYTEQYTSADGEALAVALTLDGIEVTTVA